MTLITFIDHCATGDRKLFLRLTSSKPSRAGRIWNEVFSRLGDGPLYFVIGIFAVAVQAPQALMFVASLALGFALELPAYKIIKHSCRRPRPCHADLDRFNLLPVPDQYSFPSGHTAGAFVLAGTLAHVYPAFAPAGYGLALLVGYSRVYNRLHFPADILAGGVLGTLCSFAAQALVTSLMGAWL